MRAEILRQSTSANFVRKNTSPKAFPVMIGAVYSTAACGKWKIPELPAGVTSKLQL